MQWRCRNRTIDLTRPVVMGILNVTPDSFSDGDRYSTLDAALLRARRIEEEGAAIIDVGGESTRPGAAAVDEAVEIARVVPVIEGIAAASDIAISIDTSKPGVQAGLWAQYLLDNAATVPEAIALLDKIQLVMVEAHGSKATVHLAIEDASGDSAILEYIDGKCVIHHGREFHIMTNDPDYDQQLELLKAQDFSHPSSNMPLPGNVNPQDRFQRATYFLAMLPEPGTEREAVASVLSIMRNVSVPFGAPYKSFGIYNTEYRTVCDLTNQRYFFELTTSPSVVWADLEKFNLAPGAHVMVLNPDNPKLSGDVTKNFMKAAQPPF